MGFKKLMDFARKLSIRLIKACSASQFFIFLKLEIFDLKIEVEKRSTFSLASQIVAGKNRITFEFFRATFRNPLKINGMQKVNRLVKIFQKKPLTIKFGHGKKFGLKNVAI